MTPRTLVSILAAFSFAATIPAQDARESVAENARPNIVLVMADDQGWGDVAARGHPHLKTPTLDALYRGAIRFERFYAQSPVCSPTRASVLTGRHPARCGIMGANNGHLPATGHMTARLRAAGYRCGHFGKWHLGTLSKTIKDSNRGGPRGVAHFAPPWLRGFDVAFSTEAKVPTYDPMRTPQRFAGGVGKKKPGSLYGTYYWSYSGEGTVRQVPEEELKGDDSALIVKHAAKFVTECSKQKQPFFAIVWFHAPHLPVVAGEDDLARYADIEGLDPKTRHYYGCITALDRALGQLRTTLRDCGVGDDTILWYCSDNGPEGKAGKSPGRSGGLRGRKRSLYEGGVRVPAFFEWPARFPEARVVNAPCGTSDIAPTLLSMLAIENDEDPAYDGMDITKILSGASATRGRPIGFSHRKTDAWIEDRYKLVVRAKKAELYDIANDVRESKNLAVEEPERARAMLEALQKWKGGLR